MARRAGRKQVHRRELTDEREQQVLLPVARQQVSERLARSRRARRPLAERPQVDSARLAELQERVARVLQAPQVLALRAQQDAREVRSPDAAAPPQVSSMEPRPRDGRQPAVRVRIQVQRATRAQRDAPQQERLQQALRAEAP